MTTPDVDAALAVLSEARDRRDEAEGAFQVARDGVGEALRLLGLTCLLEGTLPPLSLLRELYWQCPEVRVSDIGRAFALHASEVHRLAGPGIVTDRCRACEVEVRRQVESRSGALTARSRFRWQSSDWRICDNCRPRVAARLKEANERREREREAEDREYERIVEEARRAGKVRGVVIEEVAGVPTSWSMWQATTEEE